MLIQFAIENFLSFRERTVLSMRTAPGVAREPASTDASDGTLRCAAIYGANASGKTNLVLALAFMREHVCQDVAGKSRLRTRPFRLDPAAKTDPSRFEVYLRSDAGVTYGYGFAALRDRIVDEWLSVLRGEDEQRLFERDDAAFEFDPALFDEHASDEQRQLLDVVKSGVHASRLLMCTAQALELDRFPRPIREVVQWFRDTLVIVTPEAAFGDLIPQLETSEDFRTFVNDTLLTADTGISAIRTRRRELRDGDPFPAASDESTPDDGSTGYLIGGRGKDRVCFAQDAEGRRYRVDLRFTHAGLGDSRADFSLGEESDGTVRLLDLAPILYRSAQRSRSVYIVDELDRSVHTLLSQWFIARFLSHGDPRNQLIFTTHDTNLLDLRSLLPDSVWFAEKSRHGASALHSLAEYKQDQLDALCGHIEEGYLVGRFGAIPFLGDPARLGWPPGDGR